MTVGMNSLFNDSDASLNSAFAATNGGDGSQESPGGGGSNQSPLSRSNSIHAAFNWFYDKSDLRRTPSILDGITYDRERRYRNEGARFILTVGSHMKLCYTTLATGVVYFHRFYMFHSFKVFPRYVTAACCLFLAGKAEETPKKCKDIIKIARSLLTDQQFATFGDDPKEEVLVMERIILQTIRFDLQVEHPYKYLMDYAKGFKGNKEKINQVLQMAWTFTNDSYCTTISLQWEPEIVAIAMIFLASKIKYEIKDWEGRLPHQKHWWDIYVEDLSVELLEDICHQVLDLYSRPIARQEEQVSPPVSPGCHTVAAPAASTTHQPAAQIAVVPPTAAAVIAANSLVPPVATPPSVLPPPPPPPPPTAAITGIIPPADSSIKPQVNRFRVAEFSQVLPGMPPTQWPPDPNIPSSFNYNYTFPFQGLPTSVPGGPPIPPTMPPVPPRAPLLPLLQPLPPGVVPAQAGIPPRSLQHLSPR